MEKGKQNKLKTSRSKDIKKMRVKINKVEKGQQTQLGPLKRSTKLANLQQTDQKKKERFKLLKLKTKEGTLLPT